MDGNHRGWFQGVEPHLLVKRELSLIIIKIIILNRTRPAGGELEPWSYHCLDRFRHSPWPCAPSPVPSRVPDLRIVAIASASLRDHPLHSDLLSPFPLRPPAATRAPIRRIHRAPPGTCRRSPRGTAALLCGFLCHRPRSSGCARS
jgi:hypothetical protein